MHLILLLVASQVIYEWTDAEGTHFTDDRTAIPRGAKVKTTGGDDISVVDEGRRPPPNAAASPAAPDAGTRAKKDKPEVDTCQVARAAVTEAEKAQARANEKVDPGQECLAQLQRQANNGFAQAAYAQCMAGRQSTLDAQQAREEATRQRVEAAKDALRRAQAAGCQ
jgi:hypothetical protein